MALDEAILKYLDQALDEPVGLKVQTTDGERFRRRAYASRRGIPKYQDLMLRISPHDPNEVWIIKKDDGTKPGPEGPGDGTTPEGDDPALQE